MLMIPPIYQEMVRLEYGFSIGDQSGNVRIIGSPHYYSGIADILVQLIGKERAIIYTDFVKDVAPLAIVLREKGLQSWSYHGKNMSSHDKVKAVDDWCPEKSTIQVLTYSPPGVSIFVQ